MQIGQPSKISRGVFENKRTSFALSRWLSFITNAHCIWAFVADVIQVNTVLLGKLDIDFRVARSTIRTRLSFTPLHWKSHMIITFLRLTSFGSPSRGTIRLL